MQTASFQGVVKAIIYIIIFYYIIKFVMRLVIPILLKKAVQKAEENLRQSQQRDDLSRTAAPINSKDLKSNGDKKVGEYVDFEEIE